jgi:hypothetical protein
MDRVEAPSSGGDAEMTLLARDGYADEVLNDPAFGDIGLELRVGNRVGCLAHVRRGLGELRGGDENGQLRHHGSPRRRSPTIRPQPPEPFPLSFPCCGVANLSVVASSRRRADAVGAFFFHFGSEYPLR